MVALLPAHLDRWPVLERAPRAALGHAKQGNTVWARRGGLFLETVVVPTSKAQSLRSSSSPLQRRYRLATFRVDVAGGSTPRLSDAPREWVDAMTGLVPTAAAADESTVRRSRTQVA